MIVEQLLRAERVLKTAVTAHGMPQPPSLRPGSIARSAALVPGSLPSSSIVTNEVQLLESRQATQMQKAPATALTACHVSLGV
jgi:hypothetical protein